MKHLCREHQDTITHLVVEKRDIGIILRNEQDVYECDKNEWKAKEKLMLDQIHAYNMIGMLVRHVVF